MNSIKFSNQPWSTEKEFIDSNLYGDFKYIEVLSYKILETRTRQNIILVLNNQILFFNNGTIADKFTTPDKSKTDGTGGISLYDVAWTKEPISEFLNKSGMLINNPNFTIDNVIQTENLTLLLDDFCQYHLKQAQYGLIDAQASGAMPHFEFRRSVNIVNGQVVSQLGSFSYADKFDNLPNVVKMHLNAMMLSLRIKDPYFKIKMLQKDYMLLTDNFDNLVNLLKPQDYKEWNVKTQKEYNKKNYDVIQKIIEQITNTIIKVDNETIKQDSKTDIIKAIDFQSPDFEDKNKNIKGSAVVEIDNIKQNTKELARGLKQLSLDQDFSRETYGTYKIPVENSSSGVIITPQDKPSPWWMVQTKIPKPTIITWNDNDQEWTFHGENGKLIFNAYGNVSNAKSPETFILYLFLKRDDEETEVSRWEMSLPTDKSIPIICSLRYDKAKKGDIFSIRYTLTDNNGDVMLYSGQLSISAGSNYSANSPDPDVETNSDDIEKLQEQMKDIAKNLASTEDFVMLSVGEGIHTDGTLKYPLDYIINKHTNKDSIEAMRIEEGIANFYTIFEIKRNALFTFNNRYSIHFNYQPAENKVFSIFFQLEFLDEDGTWKALPEKEGSRVYKEVKIKADRYTYNYPVEFELWYEIKDLARNEAIQFRILNWQEDVDSRGYETGLSSFVQATLKGTQAIGITQADKDFVIKGDEDTLEEANKYTDEQGKEKVFGLIDTDDKIINELSPTDFKIDENKKISIIVDATGIRKKYVDDQDDLTLLSAKEYAKTGDTNTLSSANLYTDKVDESTLKLVDSETSYPEWNNIKTQDKVNQIVYKLDTTDDPVPPKPEHFLDLPICSNKEYEGEYMDVCTFSNNTGEDVYILPFGAIANITTLGNVEFGQDKIPFTLGVVLGGQGETIDSGEAEMGLQRNIAGLGVVPVIIGIANIETDLGNDMYLLKKDFKISLKLELMAYIRMYDHGTMILKDVKMPFLKKGEYDEWINQK